jgi:uncharacterized protein
MQLVRRATIFGLTIAAVFTGTCVAAEPGSQSTSGQVVVSGHAEVSVPPSTATFSIGINTRAPTAAGAADQNARLSKIVLAALERAGVTRDEIKGSHLSVNRQWEYASNGQHRKASAFEADNSIDIETHRLEKIGIIIDEALSAGATSASDVHFSADRIDEVRHQALSEAVSAARADAEVVARAGGGSLGELLLLSTERMTDRTDGGLDEVVVTALRRDKAYVPSTIVLKKIKVGATVIGRWRFVPQAAH